ncbi:MAG: hypothetical protein HONBIEJF_01567 [Fimbriimonadaceae bacterium]|nr:hypothetical protein [Fimbriimonadaceae bacterium]
MPLGSVIASLLLAQDALSIRPPINRFQVQAPLPFLQSVVLDVPSHSIGVAQTLARSRGLQGRTIWIDGTANMERVDSNEKIEALFAKLARVGFNTVVFDVKPIVGKTMYPSALAEQLTYWRGRRFPKGMDPIPAMLVAARKQGLSFMVSLNAFSEGHRTALETDKPNEFRPDGPGYAKTDQQTVFYDAEPFLYAPMSLDEKFRVHPTLNAPLADGDRIRVFSDAKRLTERPSDFYGLVVDPQGKITGIVHPDQEPINLPARASVYAGIGNAGAFLKRFALGGRIRLGSTPRFLRSADLPNQIPLMMNPHDRRNADHMLAFVKEIAERYDIDALLFDDRLRYGNKHADFSQKAKAEFETFVGETVRWPDDIFTVTFAPNLGKGIRPGRFYDSWSAFRALTVRNFLAEARAALRTHRPSAMLGVYAGSAYGDYERFGSNWASTKFDGGFPYLTHAYRKTGFAPLLDVLFTGTYYRVPTIVDAMEAALPDGRTVEAGAYLANRAVRDECWTYASIMLADFFGDRDGLERALQAAVGSSQGVMIFDLSHRIDEVWDILERAFKVPARPPHAIPGLLQQVHRTRQSLDRSGFKEPPVTVFDFGREVGF